MTFAAPTSALRRHALSLVAITSLAAIWPTGQAEAQAIDLFGSNLLVLGTSSHDDIFVYERESQPWIDASGFHAGGTYLAVWIGRDGRRVDYQQYLKSRVTWIAVIADRGDDFVKVDTDIGALIDGGLGADELHGGEGPDEIYAGGTDFIDFLHGHGGRDVLHAGRNFPLGTFRPHAEMFGGLGTDTYIYGWPDYISGSFFLEGWGWQLRADFTHTSGPNQGMLQLTESGPSFQIR